MSFLECSFCLGIRPRVRTPTFPPYDCYALRLEFEAFEDYVSCVILMQVDFDISDLFNLAIKQVTHVPHVMIVNKYM